MKLSYVGKNIQVRENFKEQSDKKFGRLDKYFKTDVQGTVTLSTEGNWKRVEVTIRVPGTILRAEETSDDMLVSVDMAVDSLVSQVRKYKTKLKKRHRAEESIRFESVPDDEDAVAAEEKPLIQRVKEIDVKPMSTDEAILQMELLNHDFYVFRDATTNEVNVVYRRKAGDYGLLVPTAD